MEKDASKNLQSAELAQLDLTVTLKTQNVPMKLNVKIHSTAQQIIYVKLEPAKLQNVAKQLNQNSAGAITIALAAVYVIEEDVEIHAHLIDIVQQMQNVII